VAFRAVSFDDAASKRIKDAATFEKRLRLESILNLEANVSCFKLRQITVEDFLKFEYVENKLVTGEDPCVDDYLHLVYTLHIGQDDKRFLSKAAKVITLSSEVRNELSCFFNASFNDLPALGVSQDPSLSKFDSSVWLCSLIDSLASEYSWSLNDILKLPLSTAFQLLQRILKRKMGDKYAMRNGITQQAKAQIMKEMLSDGDSSTTS
jgi:hypothetical protein